MYIKCLSQISTNGIITFDEPLYSPLPTPFPSSRLDVADKFIIAPFWDDTDIRLEGNVYYKKYTISSGVIEALDALDGVDTFLQNRFGSSFDTTWMLVVTWDGVHPWPNGGAPSIFYILFPDYTEVINSIFPPWLSALIHRLSYESIILFPLFQ